MAAQTSLEMILISAILLTILLLIVSPLLNSFNDTNTAAYLKQKLTTAVTNQGILEGVEYNIKHIDVNKATDTYTACISPKVPDISTSEIESAIAGATGKNITLKLIQCQ